jgi:hypothetical protein
MAIMTDIETRLRERLSRPGRVGHISTVKRASKNRCIADDKPGGLNGSTQHSGRTRLALKTKAKSLARVRSAGTLPWLGFDRVQPNRSLLPGKNCRINALDGVASIG